MWTFPNVEKWKAHLPPPTATGITMQSWAIAYKTIVSVVLNSEYNNPFESVLPVILVVLTVVLLFSLVIYLVSIATYIRNTN